MDFIAIAKARLDDLDPGDKQLIWTLYQGTGQSLLSLAHSPWLGQCCDALADRHQIELTPGELYHVLGLLGAY